MKAIILAVAAIIGSAAAAHVPRAENMPGHLEGCSATNLGPKGYCWDYDRNPRTVKACAKILGKGRCITVTGCPTGQRVIGCNPPDLSKLNLSFSFKCAKDVDNSVCDRQLNDWACLECDPNVIVSAPDNPNKDGKCTKCKSSHYLTSNGYCEWICAKQLNGWGCLECDDTRVASASDNPKKDGWCTKCKPETHILTAGGYCHPCGPTEHAVDNKCVPKHDPCKNQLEKWACTKCNPNVIVSASDNPSPDGECTECKPTHILEGGYCRDACARQYTWSCLPNSCDRLTRTANGQDGVCSACASSHIVENGYCKWCGNGMHAENNVCVPIE